MESCQVQSGRCRREGRTTQNNPRLGLQPRQHIVQNVTPNVVEIHVQVADGLAEVVEERRTLVVERLVDPELLLEPVALVLRPGDRVDLCAFLLADLAYHGARRASSAGHNQRFARFYLTYVKEALKG